MLPLRFLPLLIGGLVVGALLAFLLRRRRKHPDELERERRTWINTVGRITDGTVLDVHEMNGNGNHPTQLII